MADSSAPTEAAPLEGLPRCLTLERVAIRTRDSSATRSAWRLAASCNEGEGSICLVEVSPQEIFYRGEGVFLGWPQERLEAAYRVLLPQSDEPTFESNQLG